jgi:hypothetical protein
MSIIWEPQGKNWDAASFDYRCAVLRKCFPFDYLLTPKPFLQAATQNFETLPLHVQTAIRSTMAGTRQG